MSGTDAEWDSACERMAGVLAMPPGGGTALQLATIVDMAWEECARIHNTTGYDIANPEPDEQHPADYAERAWQTAAVCMLERIERVRELARRVSDSTVEATP